MSEGEFSVYQFFKNGVYDREVDHCDHVTAVETFARLINNVAARTGITRRVIITDGGDHTSVEWKFGEGITYPDELKKIDFSRRKKSEE